MKNVNEKNLIGEQIVQALLAQPIQPLPPEKFIGKGRKNMITPAWDWYRPERFL